MIARHLGVSQPTVSRILRATAALNKWGLAPFIQPARMPRRALK